MVVNLLPWRENARLSIYKELKIVLMLLVFSTVILLATEKLIVRTQINAQENRILNLQKKIKLMEGTKKNQQWIAEIKQRNKKLTDLLMWFGNNTPAVIYLKEWSYQDGTDTLMGVSDNEEQVSKFLSDVEYQKLIGRFDSVETARDNNNRINFTAKFSTK